MCPPALHKYQLIRHAWRASPSMATSSPYIPSMPLSLFLPACAQVWSTRSTSASCSCRRLAIYAPARHCTDTLLLLRSGRVYDHLLETPSPTLFGLSMASHLLLSPTTRYQCQLYIPIPRPFLLLLYQSSSAPGRGALYPKINTLPPSRAERGAPHDCVEATETASTTVARGKPTR